MSYILQHSAPQSVAQNIGKYVGIKVMCGTLIFIVVVLGLNVPNVAFMLGAMIVVCIGNFITHKPIANGLYVSFYYLGETLCVLFALMLQKINTMAKL
ncbi:MAG: hypothetical protein ACTTIV_02250 [Campylobacter sp.]